MIGVMSDTWGRGTGERYLKREVRESVSADTLVDIGHWRAVCAERCQYGSARDGRKRSGNRTSLAVYSTAGFSSMLQNLNGAVALI
jgi:hypothetical protein